MKYRAVEVVEANKVVENDVWAVLGSRGCREKKSKLLLLRSVFYVLIGKNKYIFFKYCSVRTKKLHNIVSFIKKIRNCFEYFWGSKCLFLGLAVLVY